MKMRIFIYQKLPPGQLGEEEREQEVNGSHEGMPAAVLDESNLWSGEMVGEFYRMIGVGKEGLGVG